VRRSGRIAVALAIVAIAAMAVSLVVCRTSASPCGIGELRALNVDSDCASLSQWIEAELAGDWSGRDGVNPVLLSFSGNRGVCAWSAGGGVEVCDVTLQEPLLFGAALRLTGSTMGNLDLVASFDGEYEKLTLSGRGCVLPWRSPLVLQRGLGDRSSFERLLDDVHSRARDRTADANRPQ